jgi:hypothetical protein
MCNQIAQILPAFGHDRRVVSLWASKPADGAERRKQETNDMRARNTLFAAAGALAVLAFAVPARADWGYDHGREWHQHEVREHQSREFAWHEHAWRPEHRPQAYVPPPVYHRW